MNRNDVGTLSLTLKRHGVPIISAIYTIYTGFTKLINLTLYNYVFAILLYKSCKAKKILILNIDDQNATYVFAIKGTHAASLFNFYLQ